MIALPNPPRAASIGRTNQELPVVTRHGMRSPHAATPPFRPMAPHTPCAKIVTVSRRAVCGSDVGWMRSSHLSLFQHLPADSIAAAAPLSSRTAKTRNPHRPSSRPRGFVLGRFPYAGPCPDQRSAMAGARKPSPSRPPAARALQPETGRSRWPAGVSRRRRAHPRRGYGHALVPVRLLLVTLALQRLAWRLRRADSDHEVAPLGRGIRGDDLT